MEWIKAPWDSWPFFVGWVTIIVAVTRWWAKSGMKAVRWISQEDRMRSTLRKILPQLDQVARQFPQNGGPTMLDYVLENQRQIVELRDDVSEIKNLMETHIVQRKPGGDRSTDPE